MSLCRWDSIGACDVDESGIDKAESRGKVANGRRVACASMSLGVCSLSVLRSYKSHCSRLFLCMVVRQ